MTTTFEEKIEAVDDKLKLLGFPEADRAHVERTLREVFADQHPTRVAIVDFADQSLFELASGITKVYAEGLRQGQSLPRRLPISEDLAERREAERPGLEERWK